MNDSITHTIIGAAFCVHNQLGSGFLEKVYENALVVELRQAGLKVSQQHPIVVYYKTQSVGNFVADLLINNKIIVEIKAIEQLAKIHEVQLVNYLNATQHEIGLLINFGTSVKVKRKYRR